MLFQKLFSILCGVLSIPVASLAVVKVAELNSLTTPMWWALTVGTMVGFIVYEISLRTDVRIALFFASSLAIFQVAFYLGYTGDGWMGLGLMMGAITPTLVAHWTLEHAMVTQTNV